MTKPRIVMTGMLVCLLAGTCLADSLYDEKTFRAYTADNRARLPGDLLTVVVLETSSATTSTDTSADRTNDLGIKLGIDGKASQGGSLQTGNGYDARGRAQRSGRLLAQITVAVTAVRPNGDLQVNGRQVLDINDEKQEIFLTGVVRPADIDDRNVVQSSRLSEASIRYAGEGELANRARPSWWNRLLGLLGW
ncbi:flagellar basal body L-ring protein FlgH [Chitinimonas sp. JJ19]|uniref:flagellar basal body L-ring protein FlgH n=1 Tax=Chitinimonas sp. JJ19 TaxID=3109352 RepID=UPI0030016B6E